MGENANRQHHPVRASRIEFDIHNCAILIDDLCHLEFSRKVENSSLFVMSMARLLFSVASAVYARSIMRIDILKLPFIYISLVLVSQVQRKEASLEKNEIEAVNHLRL